MDYTQRAFHEEHGTLMRIAPNEVACSDPEVLRIIYTIKGSWNKTGMYCLTVLQCEYDA
jgi:hypothetical protein